jgi:TATA-box binding protein (TBP) (component of TFIID and TFIIIB)
MLSVVNIVAKAVLASVDLHGYAKASVKKGKVNCKLWADGRALVSGGCSEQECRDAVAQCGTVTTFKIVNTVATATLPYTLPLETVAEKLDGEYNKENDFDGVVYSPEKCKVLIFASGSLVFVGSATVDVYEAVLTDMRVILDPIGVKPE